MSRYKLPKPLLPSNVPYISKLACTIALNLFQDLARFQLQYPCLITFFQGRPDKCLEQQQKNGGLSWTIKSINLT